MAFYGHAFSFNGIPCEDFDLMLYQIGEHQHSTGKFASGLTIVEEKIPGRWKPIFYGAHQDGKLEFSIVFGVDPARAESHKHLNRYELAEIANWLTGHNRYLWLDIEQDDMAYVRYNCIITDLEMIEYGMMPWALTAKVTCDSPYGYLFPQTFEHNINGTALVSLYNESGHIGYYRPVLEIVNSGQELSIINHDDQDREFVLDNLPGQGETIRIDCDLGMIECSTGANLYSGCNFKFLRLVNGHNTLEIAGKCTLRITCAFPVNVGG